MRKSSKRINCTDLQLYPPPLCFQNQTIIVCYYSVKLLKAFVAFEKDPWLHFLIS